MASAYHRKIGRETTADPRRHWPLCEAYHRKIGRETTAERAGNLLHFSLPQENR